MTHKSRKPFTLCGAVATMLLAAGAYAQQRSFDLPEQDATQSIPEFARQAGILIAAPTAQLKGLRTPRIQGEMDVREALALLLAGTGLRYEVTQDEVVVIRGEEAFFKKASFAGSKGEDGMWLAQVEGSPEKPGSGNASVSPDSATSNRMGSKEPTTNPVSLSEEGEAGQLDEIVVTGSHIRGARNTSSPVVHLSRQDIERSGLATTEQLIRSLSQNFSGGASDSTIGAILNNADGGSNVSSGVGVNLRGLGSDSTLVLLNGRRLAPTGVGDFVDISLIPLSAIERIEVLTDGASAIYGSDAVGGVVNIIPRTELAGGETHARYGSVTHGAHYDLQIGQVFGDRWERGSGLISYDYYERSSLDSRDRSFTFTTRPRTDLFPEENRHNLLLSLAQELTSQVQVASSLLYSEREGLQHFNATNTSAVSDTQTKHYAVNIDLMVGLSADWQGSIAGVYGRNDANRLNTQLGSVSLFNGQTDVWAFDTKVDGPILRLPGGDVKLAAGAHHRSESYLSTGTLLPTPSRLQREVHAAFGEIFVPVVGTENRRPGVYQLELTVAGRYEKYSDFGSTTNPKVGLRWSPVAALNVRGTYGTSFRAPVLSELQENNGSVAALGLQDPAASGGVTPTILIFGNRSTLAPEEADTWTAGIDFAPNRLPELSVTATYFDIDFNERIGVPAPGTAAFTVFLNEALYASAITRNPDLALVSQLFARPGFSNTRGYAPVDIGAILDNRLNNIARRIQRGLDVTVAYQLDTSYGVFDAHAGGTYLFEMSDQATAASSPINLVDTVYQPAALKLRNRLGWSRNGLLLTAFLNHVGSYHDTRPTSAGVVASWTTMDFTGSYRVPSHFQSIWARGLTLSLSAQNVFDRDPPVVFQSLGLRFDATNANALGRMLSLHIKKGW